ncbi:hypothetical protein [Streptomyces sp. NPDC050560]|uniref:hypothetical protein n=1 Tax=Streptomyces sp. NPDC050560 TaxID=3365630 RepID=UPI00379B32F1
MDARPTDPAEEWPLPPVWMFDCRVCVELYKDMKRAPEVVDAAFAEGGPGVDHDPMDAIVSTQIRLSQHIATRHTEEVPEADSGCERCVTDVTGGQMPRALVLEHRARHLFAPPSIVGLM